MTVERRVGVVFISLSLFSTFVVLVPLSLCIPCVPQPFIHITQPSSISDSSSAPRRCARDEPVPSPDFGNPVGARCRCLPCCRFIVSRHSHVSISGPTRSLPRVQCLFASPFSPCAPCFACPRLARIRRTLCAPRRLLITRRSMFVSPWCSAGGLADRPTRHHPKLNTNTCRCEFTDPRRGTGPHAPFLCHGARRRRRRGRC